MASRFVTVADEQIFVLNEATISPNTKKATTFCLTIMQWRRQDFILFVKSKADFHYTTFA
jgi:hypothetical protein